MVCDAATATAKRVWKYPVPIKDNSVRTLQLAGLPAQLNSRVELQIQREQGCFNAPFFFLRNSQTAKPAARAERS